MKRPAALKHHQVTHVGAGRLPGNVLMQFFGEALRARLIATQASAGSERGEDDELPANVTRLRRPAR